MKGLGDFFAALDNCPYQRTENSHPRYLDTVINNIKNEVACEVTCTFHEPFTCRAFAYFTSASQCFLSGDDKGQYFLLISVLLNILAHF